MTELQHPPQTKPQTDPNLVFVLGLLSLILCQLGGPFAFYFGQNYMAECEELGVEPEGLAVAGRIMGLISSIILAVFLLLLLAYFLVILIFAVLYIVMMVVVVIVYVFIILLFVLGALLSGI